MFDLSRLFVFQVPIIPVVFSSYSNFYLRKEKQFKSGNWSLDFPHFCNLQTVLFSSLCLQEAARCFCKLLTMKFSSASAGTIRLKILPKIETKGMTTDDITSLSDKSFNLMRSAFLNVSDSVTQSNGPLRHWTFYHTPASFFSYVPVWDPFLPQTSPLSPWPGNNMTQVSCHEISSCLVDAWSSPPLARPYSTVSPDPHCVCSSTGSSSAALHAVSGVTDGKPNSMDVCCSSCMPFWMALSTCIVALFSGFGSPAWLLTYFITVLYFLFWPYFAPIFSVCLLFHASISSFTRSPHVAFVLNTHMHTRIQSSPIFSLSFPCSLPPFFCIPVSCLKTNGSGSPRAVECAEVRGRHRSATDFFDTVAATSTLYPCWLFDSMTNRSMTCFMMSESKEFKVTSVSV